MPFGSARFRVVALLLLAATASAETSEPPIQEVLRDYLQDPATNRGTMLEAARANEATLTPIALFAAGDAEIRSGRPRAATPWFIAVAERGGGPPWTGLSELGLGYAALAWGRFGAARRHYAAAADGIPNLVPPAAFALTLMDAMDSPDGGRALDELAASPGLPPELREAALFGAAYARYWSGDLTGAAAAFADFAATHPDSRFADDAAYAAGWARLESGDRAGASAAFESVVGDQDVPTTKSPSVSRALRELQPRAILREGFRRYRSGPARTPETQLTGLLDGDGVRLARAALGVLAAEEASVVAETTATAPRRPGEMIVTPAPAPATAAANDVPGAPAPARATADAPIDAPARETAPARIPWLAILLGASLLVLAGWWLRAGGAGQRRGSGR